MSGRSSLTRIVAGPLLHAEEGGRARTSAPRAELSARAKDARTVGDARVEAVEKAEEPFARPPIGLEGPAPRAQVTAAAGRVELGPIGAPEQAAPREAPRPQRVEEPPLRGVARAEAPQARRVMPVASPPLSAPQPLGTPERTVESAREPQKPPLRGAARAEAPQARRVMPVASPPLSAPQPLGTPDPLSSPPLVINRSLAVRERVVDVRERVVEQVVKQRIERVSDIKEHGVRPLAPAVGGDVQGAPVAPKPPKQPPAQGASPERPARTKAPGGSVEPAWPAKPATPSPAKPATPSGMPSGERSAHGHPSVEPRPTRPPARPLTPAQDALLNRSSERREIVRPAPMRTDRPARTGAPDVAGRLIPRATSHPRPAGREPTRAATPPRGPARPSVTVSIGKLEILQKPAPNAQPTSVTHPRAHQIDPGLPFGGLSTRGW
jgi:hypothetical protein